MSDGSVVHTNELSLLRDAITPQATGDELALIAETVESLLDTLRMRREEAARDRWRIGALCAILGEPIQSGILRFEVLREAGFYAGMTWREWLCMVAEEVAGVSVNTLRTWIRAAQVYLLDGDDGVRGGLSVQEFIATVPMDKALRALHLASMREMSDEVKIALTSPEYSVSDVRFTVATGTLPPSPPRDTPEIAGNSLKFEDAGVAWYVSRVHEDGRVTRRLICRPAIPDDGLSRAIYEAMRDAAETVIAQWREQ